MKEKNNLPEVEECITFGDFSLTSTNESKENFYLFHKSGEWKRFKKSEFEEVIRKFYSEKF